MAESLNASENNDCEYNFTSNSIESIRTDFRGIFNSAIKPVFVSGSDGADLDSSHGTPVLTELQNVTGKQNQQLYASLGITTFSSSFLFTETVVEETQAASSLLEQLSADSHRASPSPPVDDVAADDGFPRDGSESASTLCEEEGAGGTSRGAPPRYVLESTTSSSGTAADQIMDLHREPQLRKFYIEKSIDGASYKVLDDMHYQMASLVEERGGRRASVMMEAKIPRPPNAFMIYANEFRRVLASEFPRESNKEISVRLGTLWKHMEKGVKDKYFHLSRVVDAEHKKRYPNYVYNPKEARMRKAIRDQTREANRLYSGKISSSPTKRAHSGQLLQPNESPQSRRMLESPKGKMPSGGAGGYNPPHWPGDGVNQYCGGGSEGFMDIPYQAHDGGVYSNIVNGHSQSQWYPYAMQQDGGTMQYAQAWPPHGSPVGYSAQRMQYAQMQPSAHEPGQQPGFQNYEQPSEASQQQQQQQQAGVNVAKVSKRGDNAEPVQQTGSAAAGPSSFQGQPNTNVASTSNGSARRQANAAKPDAATTTSQQESGSTTPQMSPTRAYNKYLLGNELSPPNNWPFVRMSPPDDRANLALTGSEKGFFNYFNDSIPQFTYYDYGMMPVGDYASPVQHDGRMHYVNHAPAFSSQPSKAEEYARGMRQIRPPTMKPMEECSRQRDRLNLARVARQADETRRPVDSFSTVTLSVMTEDVSKRSGGRVIATYESQGDAPDRPGRGMPDISASGVGDDLVGNKTFSFMQDQSLRNMMKPIDAADNPKIIHQGKNVCVMTNDPFEELNDLAGGNSDNSLDSM